MPSRAAYTDTLDELANMLRRKPMTARQISERFGCSRPVAYDRLEALRLRGEPVCEIPLREARRGPRSKAYGIR
jgi:hypothetical protein